MTEMADRQMLLQQVSLREALSAVDDTTRRQIDETVADLERLAFVAGWDAHRGSDGYQLADCYDALRKRQHARLDE